MVGGGVRLPGVCIYRSTYVAPNKRSLDSVVKSTMYHRRHRICARQVYVFLTSIVAFLLRGCELDYGQEFEAEMNLQTKGT
jgi:hypothetical protein